MLSAGIEPASVPSEGTVLSIELREQMSDDAKACFHVVRMQLSEGILTRAPFTRDCNPTEYYYNTAMKEKAHQQKELLEDLYFKGSKKGDVIKVVTGLGKDQHLYTFVVEDPKRMAGQLTEKRPGHRVGPAPVFLGGSGRWTTRAQNPVQQQESAITINHYGINRGSYLIATPNAPGNHGRLFFDKKGQEIRLIQRTRSK